MSVDIADRSFVTSVPARLLAWYDGAARTLPWRAPPGAPPADPYRVWLSEVMLQQTTVATVAPYFERFTARWPTVGALAAATDADVMRAWAGLGYYARARNLIACARVVAATGAFPRDEAGLRALPGIGAYTAAAIASIAFGARAVVVDGNVERVVARLFALDTPLPAARPELRRLTDAITPPVGSDGRFGDFAQAMMDLGATVCTPRAPACAACPLFRGCRAAASGDPGGWPRRAPKSAKPVRHASAWWIAQDGRVLLVRRPPRGLLGGMRALPTTGLDDGVVDAAAPGAPVVVHVFTHFTLHLHVMRGEADAFAHLQDGAEWWDIAGLADAGLPTLYAKAARRMDQDAGA